MKEQVPWRTFSIFISSTFADFQAERDYLKQFVFPRVEEELQKRRIKLEIVDLRWGVDTTSIGQEDEREATVLKVCLDEIKRCRPFFIGLLGDRYGWVPPEERMKDAINREGLETSSAGKSVTALEIEFGVLASKEQLSRSVFYIREFNEKDPYKEFSTDRASMFSDVYNPKLNDKEKEERAAALSNLKTSIKKHFESKNLQEKVKTYKATWDKEKEKVIGLEKWDDIVYQDILNECKSHAEDTWHKIPKDWQEQELALLDAFIERHTSLFCGRKALLEGIKQHLLNNSNENWGMILTGESGSGKSAVFAMVKRKMEKEDCYVLAHSAGLSPRSKNVMDLLLVWNNQMRKQLGMPLEEDKKKEEEEFGDLLQSESEGIESYSPETEIEKIQETFSELLFSLAEKQQVVLLIDAMDQFAPTNRARYMTWLPTVMPGNARLLCTAITGTADKAVEYHDQLFVKSIDHFTVEEAQETLTMLCKKEHKTLPKDVETILLTKKRGDGEPAISSPLWLSLAMTMLMALDHDDFEKMRKLEGRGDEIIEDYMESLANGFPPLPGKLFINLIEKAADIFGKSFTRKVFNHIACTRDGLRESDLEKLIPKNVEKWDALLFANLRRWFKAQLREEGEGVQWDLAHSILRNTLLDSINESKLKNIHQTIADYILYLPSGDDLRASETMYHLMQANNAQKGLKYYISDLTERELDGASNIIAEEINNGELGIEFVDELLNKSKDNDIQFMKLVSNFIYDVSRLLKQYDNLEQMLNLFKKIEKIYDKLTINISKNPDFLYDFGSMLLLIGNIYKLNSEFNPALQYYLKSLEVFRKVSNNDNFLFGTSRSFFKQGETYKLLEEPKPDKSLQCYYEAQMILDHLHKTYPINTFIQVELTSSYLAIIQTHKEQEDLNKALSISELLVCLAKSFYEKNPRNVNIKSSYGISLISIGEIYNKLDKHNLALEFTIKGSELLAELIEVEPDNKKYKTNFASSLYSICQIYNAYNALAPARYYSFEAFKLYLELNSKYPYDNKIKECLTNSFILFSDINSKIENFDQTSEYLKKGSILIEEYYEIDPNNLNLTEIYAEVNWQLGDLVLSEGNNDLALSYYKISFNVLNKIDLEIYNSDKINSLLSFSYTKLSEGFIGIKDYDSALEYLKKDLDLSKKLYHSNKSNQYFKINLVTAYEKMGDISQAIGSYAKALEYFNNRLKLISEIYYDDSQNNEIVESYGISFYKLAMIYKEINDHQNGEAYFAKWKKIISSLEKNHPQVIRYIEWNKIVY